MPILESITIVSAVFKALPPAATAAIAKSLSQTKAKVLGRYERSFAAHLNATLNKCGYVQTIFTDDKKVPLRSIYTNLYLSGVQKIRDDDVINTLGNIVICGTGGAGKTMLMKYLAINVIEYPIGKIPLFIELRNLPSHLSGNFNRAVFEYCNDFKEGDQYDIFREGLRNGLFLIFFDGLDEIPSNSRDQVFGSIKRMAREFPKCKFIASSRPEIDTRNWGELATHHILGLTANQAKNLIEKVDFPKALKEEFIGLLDQNFYSKHRSFLEVPLLCSLMLLTYHEYQSIPSRITVFYDQSFETLMRRHDRSKEGFFKRQLESGLSSDRFRKVFAAFCYRTLAKQEVTFSDQDFRHHLARSAAATEIEVDVDCFASDLVSHVCVVMRDGLNLHFIHRSFQEYFAAVYLIKYRAGNVTPLYDRLFLALNVNDVSLMAFDLDPQAFERDWALPACRRIKEELDAVGGEERPLLLLRLCWYSLRLEEDDKAVRTYSWMGGNPVHHALLQLVKVYSSLIPGLQINFTGQSIDGRSLREDIESSLNSSDIVESFDADDSEDRDEEWFIIKETNLGWINNTSMIIDLSNCVEAIYNLHSGLEARVSQREMIDLLN